MKEKIENTQESCQDKNSLFNQQRREIISAGVGITLMVGLGAVGKAASTKNILRPPGGQNEESFLAKCIKCDRCRSVCPTDAIGIASMSDGFLEARTPIMKFHLGVCTFCNKCVEVCPTNALEQFDMKTVKIGVAKLTNTCIALTNVGCTICYEACKYDAISLDKDKVPVIDENKCNGCGICENICPALVLRSYVGGKIRGIEVRPIV